MAWNTWSYFAEDLLENILQLRVFSINSYIFINMY